MEHQGPKSTSKMQLGAYFLVALLLVLMPVGLDRMGIPQNFWFGIACWAAASLISVRLFWVWPIWAAVFSPLEKGATAFAFYTLLACTLWHPLARSYARLDYPSKVFEIEQLPYRQIVFKSRTPFSRELHDLSLRSLEGTDADASTRVKRDVLASDQAAKPRRALSVETIQRSDSAYRNCATTPARSSNTATDCAPSEPKLHWAVRRSADIDARPDLPRDNGVFVTLSVDRPLTIPAFFARCDRPCTTNIDNVALSEPDSFGIIRDPSTSFMTGISLQSPRPLRADVNVSWYIEAKLLGAPPKILSVWIVGTEEDAGLTQR
jgi:hypothetical protein